MASDSPVVVSAESEQPAKLLLPTPMRRSETAPCDPAKDGLPPSAALASDSPTADGDGTPHQTRSRSGSNLPSPPGLVAPPGTPSHGSTLHGTGNCRPCAWFWKPHGCQNGQECGHCHICPEGEIKNRKKNKLTMMRLGLATPTADCASAPDFDTVAPLNFGFGLMEPPGFGLMVATMLPYAGCPPWFFPDVAFAPPSEQETTNASGSEQGSLISSGYPSEQLTARPSAEQDSAANDSRSASEKDDQEATPAAMGPPPGLKAPPNTPSHGSVTHNVGNCRPCAWFHKPTGCQNGQQCNYCHVCTDGELKSRKKNKQVAMRLGLVTPKGGASEQDARYALSLASCV